MANESDAVVETEEIEQETPETELNESTDWEAEAKKARGIAARLRTKLTKATEKKTTEAPAAKPADKKGFDYAEKAYLKSSGIAPDEFALVDEIMAATGKSLDDVLEAKYFQQELKDRRDAKASKDAIPSGTKRSTSSTRDSVEYWIAKGELPPADQVDLRRKVVNAKIKNETSKSQFSDRSVV